ncbi:hypothetical protein BLOT_008883 [Blomia tropicalis]|nr:hypothetical protein BLOT_008883 [Blomia tropicalis]
MRARLIGHIGRRSDRHSASSTRSGFMSQFGRPWRQDNSHRANVGRLPPFFPIGQLFTSKRACLPGGTLKLTATTNREYGCIKSSTTTTTTTVANAAVDPSAHIRTVLTNWFLVFQPSTIGHKMAKTNGKHINTKYIVVAQVFTIAIKRSSMSIINIYSGRLAIFGDQWYIRLITAYEWRANYKSL